MREGRFSRCGALAALAAAVVAALAPGQARAECEPYLPVASVTPGMTATGWTVEKGRTRVPFDVEVLGVATDALGPGRDLIIVEVDGPEIDAAGGIWAGMSGSPVYAPGGQFVGAVGYGFSFGPSKIGGVTPAEDMLDVLDLPPFPRAPRSLPRRASLDGALARAVARAAGVSAAQASTMTRLSVPLAVSGLDAAGLQILQKSFGFRQLQGGIPFAAGATAAGGTFGAPPEAGDNFAAALSYGAVSMTALGTTSYVCGSQAVAFGHPFLHGGPAHLGANAADAFGVVADPTFGPYKFGQAAEPLGVVDQDRLAGIRAELGAEVDTIPIEATVHVPERGISRSARTDLVANDQGGYATFATLLSLFGSAFDAVGGGFDNAGRGTARVWWTLEGERADGSPWRLARGNRFVSRSSVAATAAFNPAIMLDALLWAPNENITVTSVKVDATLEKPVRLYRIANVLVARGNRPFKARRTVAARPGERYRFRVVLRQFEGGTRTLEYAFRLPRNLPPNSSVRFRGSKPYWQDECFAGFCFARDEYYAGGDTFEAWFRTLRAAPRDDELEIVIQRGFRRGVLGRTRLDGVVYGGAGVALRRS